jgi:hypothetical protein
MAIMYSIDSILKLRSTWVRSSQSSKSELRYQDHSFAPREFISEDQAWHSVFLASSLRKAPFDCDFWRNYYTVFVSESLSQFGTDANTLVSRHAVTKLERRTAWLRLPPHCIRESLCKVKQESRVELRAQESRVLHLHVDNEKTSRIRPSSSVIDHVDGVRPKAELAVAIIEEIEHLGDDGIFERFVHQTTSNDVELGV